MLKLQVMTSDGAYEVRAQVKDNMFISIGISKMGKCQGEIMGTVVRIKVRRMIGITEEEWGKKIVNRGIRH